MWILPLQLFLACLSVLPLGPSRSAPSPVPGDPPAWVGPVPGLAGAPAVRARLPAGLRDKSPRTRRAAVRAAAELGTREAWRAVAEALADEESEVADEAQLQLAGLTDERVLAELLLARGLRSRAPGVRERVAEALGRMSVQLDGVQLAKRISTRPADLECARMLLWTLERQGRRGNLTGDLPRVVRSLTSIARSHRDPRLRGDALLALEVLDTPGSATRIAELLEDREPVLRCAALVALGSTRDETSLLGAQRLLDDPEPQVRTAALDVLAQLGTPAALRLLIERLEDEPARRLRWRALRALQHGSGMKYRFDPRPWRQWVEGLDEDWQRPEAPTAVQAEASRARQLAGFPVHSERVAFLFDFSGSMWTEDAEGRTPKQVVEVELRRALEALPADTRFNLIPFTNAPLPWKPRLVPASKRNVRAALEFFEDCNARGRGNFYDAALLALADPEVDTLVVLTDGEPTGGTHSHLDLVAPLFLHENRLRGVAIDALLVDAPPGVRWRWEELARATGGTAVEVRL